MIELHIHWLAGLFTSSLDAYLDQALPWLLPLLLWGGIMARAHRQLEHLRRQTARLVLDALVRYPHLDDSRAWLLVRPAFERLAAGVWLPAAGNLWVWPAGSHRAARLCGAGPALVGRIRRGRVTARFAQPVQQLER